MSTRLTFSSRIGLCAAILTGLTAGSMKASAQNKEPLITIRAEKSAYHNSPITVSLPGVNAARGRMLGGYLTMTPINAKGGTSLRAQATIDGKVTQLSFVLDDLPKGETRTYRLGQVMFIRKPDKQVEVKAKGDNVEISFDDLLFTRYTTKAGPNKPFFYPILTPDGSHITRRWLVEPTANPDESHDHPHHRGLWFTHSSVNGVDFWSEEGSKVGRTVNTGFEDVRSGWVYGGFVAKTEWRTPDDHVIATDKRDIRVFLLPNGDRVMDFSVTLTPVGGPLTFGDNKDGVFGLRVTDSLAIHADKSAKIKGKGHIETASGANDKDAWGKPNDWVDYWGPINGQTYGVAIFDAPTNIRHPETWHARDYGLFTVNPFGLHDFGRGDKGAGDYIVPAGKTINFTYRLLFHKGDTQTARVADEYAAYIALPQVGVKWQ